MEKVDKVVPGDIEHTLSAHKTYVNLSSALTDRMNYVVRCCAKIAGVDLNWWDWQNDGDWDDQSSGDFIHSYDAEQLTIRAEWRGRKEMVFIDKFGNEWGLEDGFPTRWLYEDFEEEFTNGLKLYKEKKQKEEAKSKEKKQKKKEDFEILRTIAKAKLTLEECKALGIK